VLVHGLGVEHRQTGIERAKLLAHGSRSEVRGPFDGLTAP